MHAYLTRSKQLLKKWRQSLALACGALAALVRRRTPILRQHAARYYRRGAAYSARFLYRIVFTLEVLYFRIRDRLGHHLPILRRGTAKCCRLCLEHTMRFGYRILFTMTVHYLRIRDWLAYYLPILRRGTAKCCRLCLEHTARFGYRIIFMSTVLCIRVAESLRHCTRLVRDHTAGLYRLCRDHTSRFVARLVFMSTVLCIRIAVLLRYHIPILLAFIRKGLQTAWQSTAGFCRACLRLAAATIRAIVRAVARAFLFTSRFLYGIVRRVALALIAGMRRLVNSVRRYTPILLHAIGSALYATAHVVNTFRRALFQVAARIVRGVAEGVLGIIMLLINIFRLLLSTLEKCLQLSWQITLRLWRGLLAVSMRAGERLYQYALLMRINKPIGIFLLLWPTLWALWIAAEGTPDLPILLIFVCGVFLMRSAGCIINDLADRDFDAHVTRTRQRPLATGKVSPGEAVAVAAVLILCAFVLVMQLNHLTIGLSVIGILLAIIYPFTKRYTYMPQVFLGLAFGWAVPMAFAAQTGAVPAMGWVLLMATVLWALVYDTMYAMVDREEDIRLGIKSTAILFEDADRFIIGVIQGLVLLTLLLIGSRLDFNRFYYAALAIAGLLFLYQQHLIRDRMPQHCFMAFMNNNWFGAMVFGGILMNYYYQYG